MTSLLKFSAIAASRGEGLHPKSQTHKIKTTMMAIAISIPF